MKLYSNKGNAKRAAQKAGEDLNKIEFFESANGWGWRPKNAPKAEPAPQPAKTAPAEKPAGKPGRSKSDQPSEKIDAVIAACTSKAGATSAQLAEITGRRNAPWKYDLSVIGARWGYSLRAVRSGATVTYHFDRAEG